MSISDNYIQYGVQIPLAIELEKKGIPVTTFDKTSLKNLVENYGLDKGTVKLVKKCIQRKPIDEVVIQELLEKSNFTCCICKGHKSTAYIIHHIVEHAKTQNNEYNNLAVLCLDDHDLPHRKGLFLTKKLTEKQIIEAKKKWEALVEKTNSERAIKNSSEFEHIDLSKIQLESKEIFDEKAVDVPYSNRINKHTKFILRVITTDPKQEFIVYLSIKTDTGNQKWIGFGTPLDLKNVYDSERVYRIGKPGKTLYTTVEDITDRINESGLKFIGNPLNIDMVRLWGWHYNSKPIKFEFTFI